MHLDNSALQSAQDVIRFLKSYITFFSNTNIFYSFQNVDIPGLVFGQADYYSYVYYKLNIDMIDIPNKI